MGSAVSAMTKSILSELDPDGALIPVSSVIESGRYKPLCLLMRKNLNWNPVLEKYQYVTTGFNLTDVMEAGDPGDEIEILQSESYNITEAVDRMLAANVAIPGQPTDMEIKGGAATSHSSSLTVNKRYVPQTSLESLKNKRKIDMSQTLIQDMKKNDENVYLITETIETEQEATINATDSFQASFSLFFSKVGIKSTGTKKKSIRLPKGSVMGFRAQLLTIDNGKWAVSYVPGAKEQTFQNKKKRMLPKACLQSETYTLTGFPHVKAEIQNECSSLDVLPPEVAEDFLKVFIVILKDPKTLTKAKVDQALYSSAQESSISELLEYLDAPQIPKSFYKMLIDKAFFFLNALNELDENGVSMLVESVEKQNTEQQLTQVETLLAENFISSEEPDDCQLNPRQARPRSILEAHRGASESWNLVVQSYAIALYAALYVLHSLSSKAKSCLQ
uniref:Gasdermin-A3-like n=1 Tax=Geotrypetes seraphini TaxID=260995 RepID=A0A6P8PI27_GEOSA|nr:gasdermin-A3-like [Geotrypetes seraphini]